jgi:hypothetical protein
VGPAHDIPRVSVELIRKYFADLRRLGPRAERGLSVYRIVVLLSYGSGKTKHPAQPRGCGIRNRDEKKTAPRPAVFYFLPFEPDSGPADFFDDHGQGPRTAFKALVGFAEIDQRDCHAGGVDGVSAVGQFVDDP